MKKITLTFALCVIVAFVSYNSYAQNSVGIGTNTPSSNAILDLVSTDQGLLVPRLTNIQMGAMTLAAADEGLIVYNSTTTVFMYWNGSAWTNLGGVDTDWTIDGGNGYVFNQTDNVGVKTNTPISDFQIGEYFHFDTIVAPNGLNFAVISNNLRFTGSGWQRTESGTGVVSYMGGGEYAVEVFDSSGAGSTALNSRAGIRLDSNSFEVTTEGQFAQGLLVRPGGNEGIIVERSRFSGAPASIEMEGGSGSRVGLVAPSNPAYAYLLTLPDTLPFANGEVLTSDIAGNLSWSASAGGSGWGLTGNAGTGAGDFVGTTDGQSLRFRTNNIERLIVDANGNFGLNDGANVNQKLRMQSDASTAIYTNSTYSGGNQTVGISNNLVSGNTAGKIAVDNQVVGTTSNAGSLYGMNSYIESTNGSGYGVYTFMDESSGASSGERTGVYSEINTGASNFSDVYGMRNYLETGGSGQIYGVYNRFNLSGSGEKFGFYNEYLVPGSKHFGLYLEGEDRNYLSGNTGIGTATPDTTLHVVGNIKMEDGNQGVGKVLTSDGTGIGSWQDATGDTSSIIADLDRDTYIDVEEGTDNDIIAFYTGNTSNGSTKFFQMDSGRFSIFNTGQSVFIGSGAGSNDDYVSNYTTAVGEIALNSNVSGIHNTAIGRGSMFNQTGSYNTAVGSAAGQADVGTSGNTYLGYFSGGGASSVSGDYNLAAGYRAGYNQTGDHNVLLGRDVGYSNSGNYNFFVGYRAGYNNQGVYGIALGAYAGYKNTTGGYSVNLGYYAGYGNTASSDQINIGRYSGRYADGGLYGIHMGYYAGRYDSSSYNVMIGRNAGYNTRSGTSNVYVGNSTGQGNTTGSYNVGIGDNAGGSNSTGFTNVNIGRNSGAIASGGQHNIHMGHYSGYQDGANYNVMLGYFAGRNATSGNNNIAIGNGTGYEIGSGSENVFLGHSAGGSSTVSQNTFVGSYSGQNTLTGGNNVALGYQAGDLNTTGSDNTFIGSGADASLNNLSNATAIGANAVVSQSNTIVLGDGANVGIGTSTPAEKLEVIGNIEIPAANDYQYASAKFGYASVAASAFTLSDGSSSIFLGGFDSGNSRWIQGGDVTTDEYMYASIQLPHGAEVVQVDFYVYDGDGTHQVSGNLSRQTLGSTVTNVMATTNSSGAAYNSGHINLVDNTISNATINNKEYAYFLRFATKQNIASLRIIGASIIYTVTKAD